MAAAKPEAVGASFIAKECHVSFNAVRKWQSYATPKLAADSAVIIAERLNIDLIWLLTGKGEMKRKISDDFEGALRTVASECRQMGSEKRIGVSEYIKKVVSDCEDQNKVDNAIALAVSIVNTKQLLAK